MDNDSCSIILFTLIFVNHLIELIVNNKYLVFFLVVSLFGSVLVVNGKPLQKYSQPLHIKLHSCKKSDAVNMGETYSLYVEWENRDECAYEGHFVLRVCLDNDQIETSDLECSYDGHVIIPSLSDYGLVYHFPVNTYHSLEAGYEEFSLIYRKPGRYDLSIGIVQG
jgi:hypothetical protein